MLRPFLDVIARGRASAEMAAEAGKLPTAAAAIIEGGRAAVAGEWEKIPPLEAILAQVRVTDAWYPEAVQLRADWRSRVSNDEYRARLGREALALIEEAIVSLPNATMFALRARSAQAADRPDVVVESINGYAQSILNSAAQLTPRELPVLSGNLQTLLDALDRLGGDARIDQERVQEVRSRIKTAREQLLARAAQS
jgi:hypothetical protein